MSKIQRIILEIVLTLTVIALIVTLPSVSRAEPVRPLTSDCVLIGSMDSNPAIPESVWPLGIALVGLAVMVRRKAA